MEKQDLTQQKHAFTNQNKFTTTQKTKARFSWILWHPSGNGEGLFWFQRFINLSLTYQLIHLTSYLQPRLTRRWQPQHHVHNVSGWNFVRISFHGQSS